MSAPEYLRALVGTIGADPVHRPGRGRIWAAVAAEAGEVSAGRP
jgi:hypothetical protein